MAKLVDLTGQKFGKLVVLHRDVCKEKEKNNNTTYWKCKCECGNEISVASGSLKSGNTRSCGCLMTELKRQRRTDLTNRRFGKLIVLYRTEDYIDSYNKHHSKWHCQCDCGNECDVLEASLKQNLTQSCGCLHKEIVSKMFLKDIRRYDDNGNLIAKLCPTCKEWRDIEQFYKRKQQKDAQVEWAKQNMDSHLIPQIYIREDQTDRDADIMANINTYVEEMRVKFIDGREPIENFDKYLEQLKAFGLDESIAFRQEAYERAKNR